ncbi:oxidative stress survival, Svf1-like protein [Mycotypha africana]|uniref:oxidative stress survival, Svf1-like protein n=1 Tax=Mycotypha africana TaxID=64632 RepID=UPI002300EC02|nr:oxidative stress survival, Svf1-like protein [Mycotypha africana]KAI8971667.1 oxidative stress survival, Svf1-like protein [Mycotypha africana]
MASWFSQLTSTVGNITGFTEESTVKTPAQTAKDGQYFSELMPTDYEWTLASGSATENQIFYMTTKTGGFVFVQLIYSGIGFLKPTVSFTCRFYNPQSNDNKFKNINQSSDFKLSEDRRSVKTEFFNITLDPTLSSFKISITHPELIVDLDFARVDKGFKVGEGKTYLGGDDQKSAAGIVSHKFWPRCNAKGTVIIDKELHDIDAYGMFIHAIQGMQPQLIASKWNFINFQSEKAALSMMQFLTTKQYGSVEVNQGSIVVNDKLISVSVENNVELMNLVKDDDTEYDIPQDVKLTWKGKTIKEHEEDEVKDVSVVMIVPVKNLIDKIDILSEIPWFLKKLVQTFVVKPYIYQWLDEATAEITIGDEKIECPGKCYQELVFVSAF